MIAATTRAHGDAMRRCTRITQTLRHMCFPEVGMIAPADVMAVLDAAGVSYILMGNYGIAGWRGAPRATQDVDMLVRQRDHRKAVQAVRHAFPHLPIEDGPALTRFLDPATREPLIDLMKPDQPLFKIAFRQTVRVREGYRIPNLEFALACKFAAMVSPGRPEKRKLLDAADFIEMVQTNYSAIRRTRLKLLGKRIYPDGGAEILRLVDDAMAGRRLEF